MDWTGYLPHPALWAGLGAMLVAQALKPVFQGLRGGGWDWRLVFEDGHMPSSHAALITATTHALGLFEGFDSPLFPPCSSGAPGRGRGAHPLGGLLGHCGGPGRGPGSLPLLAFTSGWVDPCQRKQAQENGPGKPPPLSALPFLGGPPLGGARKMLPKTGRKGYAAPSRRLASAKHMYAPLLGSEQGFPDF